MKSLLTPLLATALFLSFGFAQAEEAAESKSLGERIAERKSRSKAPADVRETFAEGIEAVRASGIEEKALKVGAAAPKFTLSDHKGEAVSLGERLKKGPVVLIFYRGSWCPYCNLTLQAYADEAEAFAEHGAQVIAVSPELPEKDSDPEATAKLPFAVLTDRGNAVAKQFDIVFRLPEDVNAIYEGFGADLAVRNGDDSYTLPLAATYVIDREGEIRYAFAESDYTKRAEPADVLKALEKLGK